MAKVFRVKMGIDFALCFVYTMCIRTNGDLIMVKNLIKHGNSYALVIDKPIMELLQMTPETELEVTTNGDHLVISPVRPKGRQAKLNRILDSINRDFGPALKKLSQ